MNTMMIALRTARRVGWLLPPLLFVLIACLATPATAQYRLLLGSPVFTNYPDIDIPFEILDNSATMDSIPQDAFMVHENGVRMLPLEVDCGDLKPAEKVTLVFLMDVSISMAFKEGTTTKDDDSVKWRTAKRVFVEAFHKLRAGDEALFASFAAETLIEQGFTSNVRSLEDAVAGLELRSGTSIYDAVVTAATLLEQRQGKRVIILLTDGVDNSSDYTLRQAVNYAWGRNIPVHVIGLGLYFDPGQPWRVDTDTLRALADGTAGKAYFTDKSEELSAIFDTIIKSIYSATCVIRYQAPDTCRNGSTRMVVVTATINGVVLQESFTYTLPDLRSRLLLSLALPADVQRETDYSLPVRASGELRAGQRSNLRLRVRWDPAHFSFEGLDVANTVFATAQIGVSTPAPGEALFTIVNEIPLRAVTYGVDDELFRFVLRTARLTTLTESGVELEVLEARQICDIVHANTGVPTTIHGCPSDVRLRIAEDVLALSGSEFTVPVYLDAELDTLQGYVTSFSVFHPLGVEYLGYSLQGSLFAGGTMSEQYSPGVVSFEAQGAAPVRPGGLLVTLRFRAPVLKEPRAFPMHALMPQLTQRGGSGNAALDCVLGVSLLDATAWVDGVCSMLLRRVSATRITAVYPHPVGPGGKDVTIDWNVSGSDPVVLRVLDESGRVVRVLYTGPSESAPPRLTWHAAVPNGMYIVEARQGDSIDTKKLLVTR